MSETEVKKEEPKENKKLGSRKFLVWLTWCIIALLGLVITLVVLCVTKTVPDSLVELIGTVLSYLFFISLTYLGVNFGQKLGLAFAGNKVELKEQEEKNE